MNIANTLETASDVLRQLEENLNQAGFTKGADTYRSMCQVLMGQHQRALSNTTPALESEFSEISSRARAIHALISPYAEIMNRLGSIVESNANLPTEPRPATPAVPDSPNSPTGLIIQALESEGSDPLSFTALKSRVFIGSEELQLILAQLVASGTIVQKRASGRDVYVLVTST